MSNLIGKKWISVVGLEIHAQIYTKSKLFSGASTEFGSSINANVSLFDCATPGTLPVLNRRCVEAGVLTALALSCKVNETSNFDRKHYFYADLPNGYQITQQRQPLAVDGELCFNVFTPGVHKTAYPKVSKLKQLQLEQDSGKSIHDSSDQRSYIDLNRAGVPLMEFVFEPDLKDGEEAAALVKELCLILTRLKTCSCKMAEGALRVDANVSVHKCDEPFGVRTEIKNIGSPRGVAAAIKYEIKRQIQILDNGHKVSNETRAWDVENHKTVSMRDKEEKQDYRFMPEPNLPPLRLYINNSAPNNNNLIDVATLKNQIPELPNKTRENLKNEYHLSTESVLVLVNEPILLNTFTHIIEKNPKLPPKLIAKTLIYDILQFLNENHLDLNYCFEIKDQLVEIVELLHSGTVNWTIANKVLNALLANPQSRPVDIVQSNNWALINDEEKLLKLCEELLKEEHELVKKYKAGKKKLFQLFMKKIVHSTNGRINMKKVDQILRKLLDSKIT